MTELYALLEVSGLTGSQRPIAPDVEKTRDHFTLLGYSKCRYCLIDMLWQIIILPLPEWQSYIYYYWDVELQSEVAELSLVPTSSVLLSPYHRCVPPRNRSRLSVLDNRVQHKRMFTGRLECRAIYGVHCVHSCSADWPNSTVANSVRCRRLYVRLSTDSRSEWMEDGWKDCMDRSRRRAFMTVIRWVSCTLPLR